MAGALCWAPGLSEHCYQTGEIKTGEEQEPGAHPWLWAVFPGLKPIPHSLPIPFIAQCLAESQRTRAPVLHLDGPKSPTMPKDPQSLLPSQPFPPDTVSQQRGSWVNTSHHSCQAKVGSLCHSRSPGEGEMESLGRCQGQVGLQEDCIIKKSAPRELSLPPARPGSLFCKWTSADRLPALGWVLFCDPAT